MCFLYLFWSLVSIFHLFNRLCFMHIALCACVVFVSHCAIRISSFFQAMSAAGAGSGEAGPGLPMDQSADPSPAASAAQALSSADISRYAKLLQDKARRVCPVIEKEKECKHRLSDHRELLNHVVKIHPDVATRCIPNICWNCKRAFASNSRLDTHKLSSSSCGTEKRKQDEGTEIEDGKDERDTASRPGKALKGETKANAADKAKAADQVWVCCGWKFKKKSNMFRHQRTAGCQPGLDGTPLFC